jgi:hypothetical protein
MANKAEQNICSFDLTRAISANTVNYLIRRFAQTKKARIS